MLGRHCIKTFSKTLPVIALSTGEAELMAVVRGTTEILGLRALLCDLGLSFMCRVKSDATAAIGMVGRMGLGKVRHLAVSDLWLQDKSRSGEIRFEKVPGKLNPSDALTKAVDHETMDKHLIKMGMVQLDGRPEAAPRAKVDDGDGSS